MAPGYLGLVILLLPHPRALTELTHSLPTLLRQAGGTTVAVTLTHKHRHVTNSDSRTQGLSYSGLNDPIAFWC